METTLQTKRWQDMINLAIGIWLFVSPLAMDYAGDNQAAAWNAYLMGLAIVIFAGLAVYMHRAWEEGLNMAFGVWMIISPWVLRFATQKSVTANAVIVGVIVTALATWMMMRDKNWIHEHPADHV